MQIYYFFSLITPWQSVRAYKQLKFTIFPQVGKNEPSEAVWYNLSEVVLVMFDSNFVNQILVFQTCKTKLARIFSLIFKLEGAVPG